MMATMVAVKTDRRCQARRDTPAGGGMNHMIAPMPMEMPKSFMLAPHLNGAAGAAAAAAWARTGRWGRRDDRDATRADCISLDVCDAEESAALGRQTARGPGAARHRGAIGREVMPGATLNTPRIVAIPVDSRSLKT